MKKKVDNDQFSRGYRCKQVSISLNGQEINYHGYNPEAVTIEARLYLVRNGNHYFKRMKNGHTLVIKSNRITNQITSGYKKGEIIEIKAIQGN